ncbi:hypothetical protein HG530_006031 [Fusarium avenaceum]|nr:hypothetical protein HG530_006031 [Fusarium avenaceum]
MVHIIQMSLLSSCSSPLLNLSPALLNLALELGNLLESLILLLFVLLLLHGSATNGLPLELLGTSLGDITRAVVAEELLETNLNDPASGVINDHDGGHVGLELIREGDELHALVDVGEELESTGKGQTRDTKNTVEHSLVLGKRLTEGTTLVVDGEVMVHDDFKQEINLRGKSIAKAGNIDQSHNVNSELSQDGTNDVDVEDVGLRAFLAQTLDNTSARDAEEANRHEHTTNGVLGVAKLDTLKVEDGQGVSGDKTVESENLVHLNGGDKSAATLTNDVGHCNDVSELGSKGSSNRGITKFQSRWLIVSQFSLHHARCEFVSEASGLLSSLSLTSSVRACIDDSLCARGGDGFEIMALRLGVFLRSDVLLLSLTLDSVLELGIEDEDVTIDDLDLTGDVYSSERVVSSNHDNTVATLIQHLDSFLGIILERAVQNEETSEGQVGLNLLTLEIVDLAGAKLSINSELFVSESQNTRTLASEVLVSLLVVIRNNLEHLLDCLGRTLDTSESTLNLVTSLDIVAVNHGDRALALKGRRELESALDLNGAMCTSSLIGAHESIVAAQSPSKRGESSLFHGVTNDVSLIKLDQGVGGGKNQLGFQ